MSLFEPNLYRGKRILVTGHTGFKGAWLVRILVMLGAEVFGLSLKPEANSLYERLYDLEIATEIFIDVRDRQGIRKYFSEMSFDGVFHLAAQSLVRRSYLTPLETFEINVIGTGNVLDAILRNKSAGWVVVVTTDKVYKDIYNPEGYKEDSALGGTDPYSASKAACEMIIATYQNLAELDQGKQKFIAVRSGNVIGGGDTAEDRLLPDIIRSFHNNREIAIRSPHAVRPWQHVLDPLTGYLLLGQKLLLGMEVSSAYNFGPDLRSKLTVEAVAKIACDLWSFSPRYRIELPSTHYPETELLWLNSSRARSELGWTNKLDANQSIEWTLDWERSVQSDSVRKVLDNQIRNYFDFAL